MTADGYVSATNDGVLVRVFVQPGARRDAVVGLHGDALKIKVKAPPAGGRANQATQDLVAQMLGVARGSVAVVSGRASRHKTIAVERVGPELVSRAVTGVLSSRAHERGPQALP